MMKYVKRKQKQKMENKRKIYSIEIAENPDKDFTIKELSKMVGWIDYDKERDVWDVTMGDGCGFECDDQLHAQILAGIEEVKAMNLLLLEGRENE